MSDQSNDAQIFSKSVKNETKQKVSDSLADDIMPTIAAILAADDSLSKMAKISDAQVALSNNTTDGSEIVVDVGAGGDSIAASSNAVPDCDLSDESFDVEICEVQTRSIHAAEYDLNGGSFDIEICEDQTRASPVARLLDSDSENVEAAPSHIIRRLGRNYRNYVTDESENSMSSSYFGIYDLPAQYENRVRSLSSDSLDLVEEFLSNQSEEANDFVLDGDNNGSSEVDISENEDDDDDDDDDDDEDDPYDDDADDADADDDDDDIDETNLLAEGTNIAAGVDVTTDLNEVLNKTKPNYSWNLTSELMRREHGFTSTNRYPFGNSSINSFNKSFYSSRYAIERMTCSYVLRKHTGCVNSLNFSRCGTLLCSGSDDTRIVVWDWVKNKVKHCFRSGHIQNIFQTKFIDTNGCLDIVSSSLDCKVRRSIVPSSGGKPITSTLYTHRGSVHKVVLSPTSPYDIISAGEDGRVLHKDLRMDGSPNELLQVVRRNVKMSLYSVSHHPFAPEICVSGTDNFVRVYDKRKLDQTVHEMCPKDLTDKLGFMITSSVYNHTGNEILSSYNDENIYLFNNKNYVPGEYLHRYRGHLNQQTIKGVNFFGPNSEYVISGSDCGNLFFWDKNTEAILNYVKGDTSGAVNCLESQESIPVLAISGLDHTVKVLTPSSQTYPPDLSKLNKIVKRNLKRSINGSTPGWDRRIFSYIMREMLRRNVRSGDSNDDDSENMADDNDSNADDTNADGDDAVDADVDIDVDIEDVDGFEHIADSLRNAAGPAGLIMQGADTSSSSSSSDTTDDSDTDRQEIDSFQCLPQ